MPTAAPQRGGDRPLDLLRRCPAAGRWIAASLTATAMAQVAEIGWIILLASTIDRVFLGGEDLTDVAGAFVPMAALVVVRVVCLWSAEPAAQRGSNHLRRQLRTRVSGAIVAEDPRRVGGSRVGRASATLVDGIDQVGTWVTAFLPSAAMVAVVPTMVLLTVLVLDPWTTLILLFTGPMLILLLALIGRRTADLTRRRFDELGWLRGFYLDLLAGLGTLKAFGRGPDGADLIEESSRRYGDTTMAVLRTAFQTSLVMEWAATAATALVAVQVSFRLIGERLTFGTALAVLMLTPEFFVPFRRLSMDYHAGQAGDAAATAISGLTAVAASGPDPVVPSPGSATAARTDAAEPAAAPPHLRFRDVTYSYPGATERALDGLDLEIPPGATLALVGPSGAGKSTVASLLLRFIAAEAGTVSVDGEALERRPAAAWRRRVAWVPQHPTIFSGTVVENIALGEPDADRRSIIGAAAAAEATGFVESLPDGFDTLLGEHGTTLSGGQRQRLAIARAFLRDAPLVVLDEFTAHLDPSTEQAVSTAMARLLEHRSALVIAHRVRTAAAADLVAVMDGGRVIECGPPSVLAAAGGRWADLSTRGALG